MTSIEPDPMSPLDCRGSHHLPPPSTEDIRLPDRGCVRSTSRSHARTLSASPSALGLTARFPASPRPPCLSRLNLAILQNVEKLSFQARLNCLYRQSKIFLTTPECNIFPPFLAGHPVSRPGSSLATHHSPHFLPPSHPLRPARLGALQKMREAFSLPRSVGLCAWWELIPSHLKNLDKPPQVNILSKFGNVEKFSFQARIYSNCRESRKIFSTPFLR